MMVYELLYEFTIKVLATVQLQAYQSLVHECHEQLMKYHTMGCLEIFEKCWIFEKLSLRLY